MWQDRDPLHVLDSRTEVVICARLAHGGWLPHRAIVDPDHGTIRFLDPQAPSRDAVEWNSDWMWAAMPGQAVVMLALPTTKLHSCFKKKWPNDEWLNEQAAQGWRVRTAVQLQTGGFQILFEKPL